MLHSAAWLLAGVFTASVVQQLGFVVRKIGGSSSLVVLVIAGPYVASAFAVLYVPWFERYRARLLVAVPRILATALLLLVAICTTPASVAVVAMIALAILTVGDIFYGRLLGQLYPLKVRGRMLTLPMFVQAAAMAGMSVLAGRALATSEGAYRWFLPAGAVVGALGAVLVLAFPVHREVKPPERATLRECLGEVLRNRAFLLWTVIYSVTTAGFWLSQVAKPVYFRDVLSFGYWENGVAIAVYNGATCVGFLMWGWLLDRFKSLRTMMVSWALLGAGTLLVAQPLGLWSVVVGQLLSGIGMAGNNMAWFPVVLEFAPEDRVDRYMGFYMTMFGLRVLVGGLISGALMRMESVGSRHTLALGSVVMLLGATCILALRRRLVPSGG